MKIHSGIEGQIPTQEKKKISPKSESGDFKEPVDLGTSAFLENEYN